MNELVVLVTVWLVQIISWIWGMLVLISGIGKQPLDGELLFDHVLHHTFGFGDVRLELTVVGVMG